jgi:hypothetical protein
MEPVAHFGLGKATAVDRVEVVSMFVGVCVCVCVCERVCVCVCVCVC